MKTKNFIPTLLALIIRVMVIGQTQGNQAPYRILNVLGSGKQPSSPSLGIAKQQALKQKSEAIQKDKSAQPSSTTKVYPTLLSSDLHSSPSNATKTNSPGVNVQISVIDNNTFNYFTNNNCYSTIVYSKELLKQADDLLSIEQSLRKDALTKKGDEKTKLLQSAAELFKQAEIKQIQASEISGKVSVETFARNEVVFNSLLVKITNEVITTEAESLNGEAVYSIKLAKEIREEAYSMKNNSAKLGTMSNAEEKESIALNKQDQAISLLKKSTAANATFIPHDLAVK